MALEQHQLPSGAPPVSVSVVHLPAAGLRRHPRPGTVSCGARLLALAAQSAQAELLPRIGTGRLTPWFGGAPSPRLRSTKPLLRASPATARYAALDHRRIARIRAASASSVSASLPRPIVRYSPAKCDFAVATSGWLVPSACSKIVRARL